MTLEEQRDMVERALGERMLNHAFIILHQWLQELGFDLYGDRLQSLEKNYDMLFQYYLSQDDPERDNVLDDMTGATYRLVDEVYVDICLKRGRFPQLMGFNPDNTQSVMTYFSSSARLREEDLEWIREIAITNPQPALAILVIGSMLHILRDAFSEDAILMIMESITSDNKIVSDQALITSILLLAHYDIRIDFFPKIQEAFLSAIGDGEYAFNMITNLIRTSRLSVKDIMKEVEIKEDDLSESLKEMMGDNCSDDEIEHVISWVPKDEAEYMDGMLAMLPNTWLYEAIVGEDEERIQTINRAYLRAGRMDLWWDNLDVAEDVIIQQLRGKNPSAQDYLNYGHICFLRGDRMMAFENYREAKRLCGSSKKFMTYFRPDRRFLIDRGITLEDVYLMEDQLIKV